MYSYHFLLFPFILYPTFELQFYVDGTLQMNVFLDILIVVFCII
jgi:hypothetical protein